jgi:cupin fold WbuC family metalloprotein
MKKIYSRIVPDMLLHVVMKLEEEISTQKECRIDIIPEDNFIQCSLLKMENKKTFPPHKHIKKDRHYPEQIAQESWVVIRGRVRCKFYDLDDSIIAEPILKAGDASFTLYGGHTYEILEDNTVVYEYKTGPYEGQKLDKEFLTPRGND